MKSEGNRGSPASKVERGEDIGTVDGCSLSGLLDLQLGGAGAVALLGNALLGSTIRRVPP